MAEILTKLVPLMQELGLHTDWQVINGDEPFFQCTKAMHNALQGNPVSIPERLLSHYEDINRDNAERLRSHLSDADFVFIHDPQPAPQLSLCPNRRGHWIWRCHIDASRPYRPVWKFLRPFIEPYQASIFSLPAFAQALPHPEYIISPSIDPLSDKNVPLSQAAVLRVLDKFTIDPARPLIVQVSRFDRFKDPVGVIRAYKMATKFHPDLQLVLAGAAPPTIPKENWYCKRCGPRPTTTPISTS